MSREEVVGKIEFKIIKKKGERSLTIEISRQCNDFNYFSLVKYIRKHLERALDELSCWEEEK